MDTIYRQIRLFLSRRIRFIIIMGILGTIMSLGLSAWLEKKFLPVHELLVNTFGARYAATIARETDDYF